MRDTRIKVHVVWIHLYKSLENVTIYDINNKLDSFQTLFHLIRRAGPFYLSQDCKQMLGQCAVYTMHHWGCKINPIEAVHTHGWQVGAGLAVGGGFCSSPLGPLHRAAWVEWHGDYLPPEQAIQENEVESCNQSLCDLVSKVTHLQLYSTGQSAPDSKG